MSFICPPRPKTILFGVAVALGRVDKKPSPVQFKQLELSILHYPPEDLLKKDGMVVYQKMEHL